MDVVKIKMSEEVFTNLVTSGYLSIYDYEIQSKEPEDYDYSSHDEWQQAKKASTKAYKKLKEIEFNIRNK